MLKQVMVICLCAAMVLAVGCDDEESDAEGADDSEQVEESEESDEEAETGEEEAAAGDADPEIGLELEPVILAEWEEIDDAFRYIFELDGEELGASVGGSRYFADVDSLEGVEIRGETIEEEEVGETELVSTEEDERLVLRWNEDAFDEPFMGRKTTGGGTMVLELQQMPHVLGTDPDEVELVLLGEKMEQGGSFISAPFEFDDDGELVEHGPFEKVPLP